MRKLELHVVAQVVEAELVVRPVGNVRRVRHLTLGIRQLVLDDANRQSEEPVDFAHPLRVAAGEVVVDGHDVDALALDGVQIRRKRRHQRLALAGLHLGDLAFVKDSAADKLHVEVPHVQRTAAGFPDDGEGFNQQVVRRLAVGDPALEFRGPAAQLLVRQRLGGRFERIDLRDERA